MNERVSIHVNNAGTSWPKAPPVSEAVARTLRASPRDYGRIFEEARERVAQCLGVSDPTELLLTPGCTSALSVALTCLPWEPGDVVVTSALEHEAVLRPVETIVRLRGVVHKAIAYRLGEPFDLAELDEMLAAGRVRAVAITAASNVTGERLPVEVIAERARAAGCVCIVDAAQVAGLLPLAIQRLGADAVAFAGHKGPLAPQGVGGLWMRSGLRLAFRPGHCDVGSVDLPAATALAQSLSWLESADAPPRQHPLKLRERLAKELRARPRCRVFGGDGQATGTLSVGIDGLPIDEAEPWFADRGIVVRAGRHCAPRVVSMLGAPEGTVRISFGVFNLDDDVDAIVGAIDALG